jgi:outer membrane receptor protein involved in Fe transport
VAVRARAAEQRLGEVVVTAPPEGASAAPARDPTAFATIVDTRSAPTEVETLAEVLGDAVGVQVRHFGGPGDLTTVSIRGASAGQVQVYLDGVPLSRANNEVVNLADLPLDAVDHVEVYRGTTPLAFAQSAPGGVVNIVTRRPGPVPLGGGSVSYGSFTTRKADLLASTAAGAWDLLGFAHYLGSQGDFRFTNDFGTSANPADDREETRQNNAFNLGNLTTRAAYHPPGPLSAALTADSFFKDEGAPGVGNLQALDASVRTLRQLANLDLKLTPLGGLPLDASANGYVLYQRQAFDDPHGEVALEPTDTDDRTLVGGAQTVMRGQLGKHQIPGLLLAMSDESFQPNDRLKPGGSGPARTRLRGTFAVEDEILAFDERVSILPGVRWELFRDDFPGDPSVPARFAASGVQNHDFVSPRVGLRAAPRPWLTFLANWGQYAREPNLQELFGSRSDRGIVIGNPRLKAETGTNRDVGFRLTPPARGPLSDAALEFAYFDNSIDDLIILVQNSQSVARPENVASATITGEETALRARWWRRIGLSANYTHQQALDESNVTFLAGKQLPGRPADEAFVHTELSWSPAAPLPLGRVSDRFWPGRVFYEVNYAADNFLDRANVRRVAARTLQDVGLELALPGTRWRLLLEGKNIGDDHTRDVLNFPLPGRAFYATVSWGFGGGADARP